MKFVWFLLLAALVAVNCEQESESSTAVSATNEHTALGQIWRNLACMFNRNCTDFHCKYDVDCNIKHGMHSHCNVQNKKCECNSDAQLDNKTQVCMTPNSCLHNLNCFEKLGLFSSCVAGQCECDKGFVQSERSKGVCHRKEATHYFPIKLEPNNYLSALFPNECQSNEDCVAKYSPAYGECKLNKAFQTYRCTRPSTTAGSTTRVVRQLVKKSIAQNETDYSVIYPDECQNTEDCLKEYGPEFSDCILSSLSNTRRCFPPSSSSDRSADLRQEETPCAQRARLFVQGFRSQFTAPVKCNTNWDCRKKYGHNSHCDDDRECACRAGFRWDQENRVCTKRTNQLWKDFDETSNKKHELEVEDTPEQIDP